jgi:hypothetical protein
MALAKKRLANSGSPPAACSAAGYAVLAKLARDELSIGPAGAVDADCPPDNGSGT